MKVLELMDKKTNMRMDWVTVKAIDSSTLTLTMGDIYELGHFFSQKSKTLNSDENLHYVLLKNIVEPKLK